MTKAEYANKWNEIKSEYKNNNFATMYLRSVKSEEIDMYNNWVEKKMEVVKSFIKDFNVKGTRGYNGRTAQSVAEYNLNKLSK